MGGIEDHPEPLGRLCLPRLQEVGGPGDIAAIPHIVDAKVHNQEVPGLEYSVSRLPVGNALLHDNGHGQLLGHSLHNAPAGHPIHKHLADFILCQTRAQLRKNLPIDILGELHGPGNYQDSGGRGF